MIKPCAYHVLVTPDEIADRVGSIFLSSQTREREKYSQIFGTIVAIGPTAWQGFDDGKPWAEVGDRVAFAKYGGFVLEDPETKESFRLLVDKDIIAVVSGTYVQAKEA
jgi:co-chaperonin GroES (HSP10)